MLGYCWGNFMRIEKYKNRKIKYKEFKDLVEHVDKFNDCYHDYVKDLSSLLELKLDDDDKVEFENTVDDINKYEFIKEYIDSIENNDENEYHFKIRDCDGTVSSFPFKISEYKNYSKLTSIGEYILQDIKNDKNITRYQEIYKNVSIFPMNDFTTIHKHVLYIIDQDKSNIKLYKIRTNTDGTDYEVYLIENSIIMSTKKKFLGKSSIIKVPLKQYLKGFEKYTNLIKDIDMYSYIGKCFEYYNYDNNTKYRSEHFIETIDKGFKKIK